MQRKEEGTRLLVEMPWMGSVWRCWISLSNAMLFVIIPYRVVGTMIRNFKFVPQTFFFSRKAIFGLCCSWKAHTNLIRNDIHYCDHFINKTCINKNALHLQLRCFGNRQTDCKLHLIAEVNIHMNHFITCLYFFYLS